MAWAALRPPTLHEPGRANSCHIAIMRVVLTQSSWVCKPNGYVP